MRRAVWHSLGAVRAALVRAAAAIPRAGSRLFTLGALAVIGAAAPAQAVAAQTTGVRVPAHEKWQLPNGVRVILLRRADVPMIAFTAIVRGGGRADPAGKAGLANIVATLLEKGAGERDAYAFADAVAGAGGSFAAAANADAIVVSGQFLARDRALLVELLADALLRPHLDAQEFAKLRDRAIEQIRSAKDSNPAALLSVYGRALLFGQHPYGAPLAGSERSLASLAHEDVRDYYRNHFGADRLTLVFAGDLDPKWFRRMVARAFGAMPKANSSLVPLAAPQPLGARRVLLVDKPGAVQAYFWLANVGVPRAYPRRAALDLVNTLYGGRFTSILNTELRVKSGLTYGASSAFRRGLVAGEFAISSFTQTENLGKALDLALATLQRLHAAGIDAEQLESARQYVLGQYPLRLETASHWAAALGELDLYGLGTDDIDGYGPALAAVTVDDARAVIDAAFPRPETLCIVVIGDAARIRDELAKFGPVARAALSDPDFVIDQSAAR